MMARHPMPSRWRTDLWLVGLTTVAAYAAACAMELSEWLERRLSLLERWQA
jgi:hypothetical protein